ncbi:MAG: hypothetical protein HQM12_10435 [SAR324 cluster bacterium]|nr:hypothetical protein [SAR324 cluster bacterium]
MRNNQSMYDMLELDELLYWYLIPDEPYFKEALMVRNILEYILGTPCLIVTGDHFPGMNMLRGCFQKNRRLSNNVLAGHDGHIVWKYFMLPTVSIEEDGQEAFLFSLNDEVQLKELLQMLESQRVLHEATHEQNPATLTSRSHNVPSC